MDEEKKEVEEKQEFEYDFAVDGMTQTQADLLMDIITAYVVSHGLSVGGGQAPVVEESEDGEKTEAGEDPGLPDGEGSQ